MTPPLYIFACPVCKKPYPVTTELSCAPACQAGGTHLKDMIFYPEQSSGTPKFMLVEAQEKKKKSKKKT